MAFGGWYYLNHSGDTPPTFRTAQVKRADLIVTIAATGVVQPEEVIDVGAQVVGRIKDFGIDPSDPDKKKLVDYRAIVHEGTELAYIDDEVYKAQVDQARASVARAEADLVQWKAKLEQANQDLIRAESLRSLKDISGSAKPLKGIADSDYDNALATQRVADANVKLCEATINQQKANLRLSETNLAYTIIKSPVEGVIIDRRVNIGQTVVASLNAPSLFLIAKDLSKIQVWASVNEADIGRIDSRPNMPVRFQVDAYPNETFRGTVLQVRYSASMTQNVVTYPVIIATDNKDLRLKPSTLR